MFRIGVHLTSQWERSGTAAEGDIGPYRSPRANLDAGRNAADDFSICSVAESREGSCYILNARVLLQRLSIGCTQRPKGASGQSLKPLAAATQG